MKTFNCVKLMLLLIVTFTLASCGDDNYYTDDFLRNTDDKLCSKEWVDEYFSEDGNKRHQHIFTFNKNDRRGVEKVRTWNKLGNGNWTPDFSETSSPFEWAWDKSMERITLDFWDRKAYFDNVWIKEHYLTGKLYGEHVTFTDRSYINN